MLLVRAHHHTQKFPQTHTKIIKQPVLQILLKFGPFCWSKPKKVIEMPRKCVVKVVLSKEQKEILNELARRLGTSESETLRMALMDYVKELSLMRESIHRNQNQI
jgi:hypothetical protein